VRAQVGYLISDRPSSTCELGEPPRETSLPVVCYLKRSLASGVGGPAFEKKVSPLLSRSATIKGHHVRALLPQLND